MSKILEIRNSTAEFLTFVAANREEGVQVVYKDETIWATQAAMGELFDVEAKTVGFHLQNIYNEGELRQDRTTQKIGVVQLEGTLNVNREPTFYNLDAIISVGYRVSSIRATQFRQWCTHILRQYALRGYVLDRKRMENGSFIGEDYFEHLLAESRAKRHIPMTMEDWAKRIDSYLSSDERPLLDNAGSVAHEYAKEYAETEFERYRIIQDRLFRSGRCHGQEQKQAGDSLGNSTCFKGKNAFIAS